jgi:hypothetical protein
LLQVFVVWTPPAALRCLCVPWLMRLAERRYARHGSAGEVYIQMHRELCLDNINVWACHLTATQGSIAALLRCAFVQVSVRLPCSTRLHANKTAGHLASALSGYRSPLYTSAWEVPCCALSSSVLARESHPARAARSKAVCCLLKPIFSNEWCMSRGLVAVWC